MTKFIFFGRLVEEKGVRMILDVFAKLHRKWITNRQLDIYGIWPLDNVCTDLASALPRHVFFHGRWEHKHVMNILQEKDFCLMPSAIIETFGLSWLESIRKWVPVIGYKKWGIEPFISDELNIETQEGDNDTQKLFHLVSHILTRQKVTSSYLPTIDFEQYSPERRLSRFAQIAGDAKRILLVSDFTKRVGGVENYIHDVHDLLRDNGYIVELWGMDKKNSFWGLFKTALNISAWLKLGNKIDAFKPDLVWCHSVMREIGWFPLTTIPENAKTLMMFHDMGYFHPYPSRLTDLQTLPKSASLHDRIHAGKGKSLLAKILLTLKRLSLSCIKSVFKNRRTTYLVPSRFMEESVKTMYADRGKEIIVLPHFVQ